MEEIAKGLVGHEVMLTIMGKYGSFRKNGRIVGVQDGFVRLKGPSGMETSVPLDDRWFNIKSIALKE